MFIDIPDRVGVPGSFRHIRKGQGFRHGFDFCKDSSYGNCTGRHDKGILAAALFGKLEFIALAVGDGERIQLVALVGGDRDGDGGAGNRRAVAERYRTVGRPGHGNAIVAAAGATTGTAAALPRYGKAEFHIRPDGIAVGLAVNREGFVVGPSSQARVGPDGNSGRIRRGQSGF